MWHKNLIQLLNVDLFYCSLSLDSIRVALHHFQFKISLQTLVMFEHPAFGEISDPFKSPTVTRLRVSQTGTCYLCAVHLHTLHLTLAGLVMNWWMLKG